MDGTLLDQVLGFRCYSVLVSVGCYNSVLALMFLDRVADHDMYTVHTTQLSVEGTQVNLAGSKHADQGLMIKVLTIDHIH